MQRNLERLMTAVAEAFRERGLQVPLEEIAQRAGVSPGTPSAGASPTPSPSPRWSTATIVRATAGVAPRTWRRAVAISLDGLGARAAGDPLPEPPLTASQVHQAMLMKGTY